MNFYSPSSSHNVQSFVFPLSFFLFFWCVHSAASSFSVICLLSRVLQSISPHWYLTQATCQWKIFHLVKSSKSPLLYHNLYVYSTVPGNLGDFCSLNMLWCHRQPLLILSLCLKSRLSDPTSFLNSYSRGTSSPKPLNIQSGTVGIRHTMPFTRIRQESNVFI